MKEVAVARDNHMAEVQKLASTVLSINGAIMSAIYESRNEGLDLESLLVYLADASKIVTAIIHKQSVSRKAFIEPGLSKETRAILKETKIDKFLYGENLSEKIKEARALEKMGENLKAQPTTKTNAPTPGKSLNGKTPLMRRPQMGYHIPTGGRQKKRLYFKNKQFQNRGAQGPPRQVQQNNQRQQNPPPERFEKKS